MSFFPSLPSSWPLPSSVQAPPKTTLFVYGSLLNPTSFEQTTGSQPHYTPATLAHHRRSYTAKLPVLAQETGKVVNGLFLDLKPSTQASSHVNGALVEVTADQFQRLKDREAGYRWANVANVIRSPFKLKGQSPVLTPDFPDDQGFHPGDANCFVMKRYVELVNKGVAQLGRSFQDTFKATTESPTTPVLEGAYQFVKSLHQTLWPQAESQTV